MRVFMKNNESTEFRKIRLKEFSGAVSDIMQRAGWLITGRDVLPYDAAHSQEVYEAYTGLVKEFIKDPLATLRGMYEASRKDKVAEGWVYGEEFNEAKKTSPQMLPYDELDSYVKSMDKVLETVLKSVAVMVKKGE
jgi:hypothetical protein